MLKYQGFKLNQNIEIFHESFWYGGFINKIKANGNFDIKLENNQTSILTNVPIKNIRFYT